LNCEAQLWEMHTFKQIPKKMNFKAGLEITDHEGHIFLVYQTLFGPCAKGLKCHEIFAELLQSMGLSPCDKAESDMWIKGFRDKYNYVAMAIVFPLLLETIKLSLTSREKV